MNDAMQKRQYFHLRAHGDVLSTIWVDPEDHSYGREKVILEDSILAKMGATICYIPDLDNGTCQIGVSVCASMDNFVKVIGRGRSLGKALKAKPVDHYMTTDEALEVGQELIRQKIAESIDWKRAMAKAKYQEELDRISALKADLDAMKLVSRRKNQEPQEA